MKTLKIVLANDDGRINEHINRFIQREHGVMVLLPTNGVDDTLETIVMVNPDFCFIADDDGTDTVKTLKELNEAGLKVSVIAIVPENRLDVEDDIVRLGGKGVLAKDASLGPSVRMVLRHLTTMKQQQLILRTEKEKMVSQFIDLQDVHQRTEEQSINLVTMAEDLAEAKNELESLNKEKDKFFSIIAHDLRSPFTSIMGYTELLAKMAETLSPEQIKNYSDNVNEAAHNVFGLLENLLEWARMEQGHMSFEPEQRPLDQTIKHAISPFFAVAKEKNIKILYENSPLTGFYDENMISTVIRNLVNNAIKFTPEGGVIRISAEPSGEFVKTNITDSGLGMEPEFVTNIFDVQIKTTSNGTAGEKGTGLGLVLCKELVEKNGGTITVASEPGLGSIFSFTLPAHG